MTVFYARVKGLHQSVKVKEIKKFLAPIRPLDVKVLRNGYGRIVLKTEKDFKLALKKTGKIHGKDVHVVVWPNKQTVGAASEESPKQQWPSKTPEELKSAILDSGRLFVRNLSYNCNEEQLEKLFSKYGSLSDIHLSYDPLNHTSKGFAFITYLFPADAVNAFTKLDKTKFMDRLLHILPAQEAPEARPKPTENQDSTVRENSNSVHRSEFQTTRHESLKAAAGVGHNWNALFVRPDAVATYLAAKFGLTKEQVLNPTGRGGSVAVRLAHGEAQLVTEMRDFLQRQGLNLDAFESAPVDDARRDTTVATIAQGRRDRLEAQSSATVRQVSGTAFLIKNLPVGTTEIEVRELIDRYTNPNARAETDLREPIRPKRVIVPPLGITAIVVFTLPQHARLAYRLLAYEPFQDNVLYLQWLPHGALKSDADDAEGPSKHESSEVRRSKRKRKHGQEGENTEPAADPQAEFALITSLLTEKEPSDRPDLSVKRRHKRQQLATEQEDFDGDGDATDPDTAMTSKPKVRNYENKKARLRRQQAELEQVEADATQTEPADVEPHSKEPSEPELKRPGRAPALAAVEFKPTKPVLLVRNIPFQATQDELTELFRPVGGLLRVRLPRKASGGHRGFGFVEFSTIDQAKAAQETLGMDTHFLGRRLRIEFAQG